VPVQQVFEDIFDALGQVVDVSYASGDAGTPKLAADLNANNNKITNLTTPTANGDAANKSYVDNATPTLVGGNGIDYTNPTISVDINGANDGTGITIDGSADFVLVYDADALQVKKVYTSQIATPVSLNSSKLFFALNG